MAFVEVNTTGIEQTLNTLSLLKRKTSKFPERAVKAITKRLAQLMRIEYKKWDSDVKVTYSARGRHGTVVASGKDVLFVEFGTGLPAQADPHPALHEWNMSEPMGAGTWSDKYGKGHWNDPNGWWYSTPQGSVHTYGQVSGKCAYYALKELEAEMPDIIRRVWND